MQNYKIRNANGVVVGQYRRVSPPEKTDNHAGEWNVEEADVLNDEPVEWWHNDEDQ